MEHEKIERPSDEKRFHEQKVKGHLTSDQFRAVLQQWISALDQDQTLDFSVQGERCELPADVMENASIKIEYEAEKGGYELELKLKDRAA